MKTRLQKKIEMLKLLREQYELPVIKCSRWGTNKGFTRTELLRGMLWTVFSEFIRRRDTGKCIACGFFKTFAELQAGHYVPVGGSSVDLWFDEHNVNGECEKCNAFDSFHLVPMRKNLLRKWGELIVHDIEKRRDTHLSVKWEETEYVQRIKHYLEKLK